MIAEISDSHGGTAYIGLPKSTYLTILLAMLHSTGPEFRYITNEIHRILTLLSSLWIVERVEFGEDVDHENKKEKTKMNLTIQVTLLERKNG